MAVVKTRIRVPGQNAKVAPHSLDTVPAALRELGGSVPELISAYYKWADQPGEFQGDAKVFLDYLDSDKTTDEMFRFIKETFLRMFPDNTKSSLRNLMKFAKDFYSKRGTEESYRFLFRAIFNESIDIDYPANYLFASSDGVWVKRTVMKVLYIDTVRSIVGRRLYGKGSGASALVKELSISAVGFDLVAELVLGEVVGDFIVDEIVESRDNGTKVVTRTMGSVGKYTIVDAGAGYKEGVVIPLSNAGDGNGFSAKIGAVGGHGEILSIDIISSGSGYVYSVPQLEMDSPTLFDSAFSAQSNADIQLSITAAWTESGRYSKLKSSTSDVYKLQDGMYYQNYSYVIRTNVPLNEFSGVVKSLVHPAGTIMYAQPNIDANPDNILNNTGSIMYHLSKPLEANYKNPYSESSRKFFDVDVKIQSVMTGDFTHNAIVAYTLFLLNTVHVDALDVPDSILDLLISKVLNYEISFENRTDILLDLRSSQRLYDIWIDQLDTLDPMLSRYGLSPRVTYSNVEIIV